MSDHDELSPLWYAAASVLCLPAVALLLVCMAAVMLVVWPAAPVICYIQRRRERR